MTENKKRFEKWQSDARKKFDEIDRQLGISEKVEEGVKTAKDKAKKGAESFKEGVGRLKDEAEKTSAGKKAVEVAEETYEVVEDTAKKTVKRAWEASESVRDVAEDARENAGEVIETASEGAEDVLKTAGRKFGEVVSFAGETAGKVLGQTKKSVEATATSVSKALGLGISWTRTFDSSVRTFRRTTEWVAEKPLQAAATGASVVVGAGLGVVFTGLSSHWLFNSALPAWSVQKASRLFTEHLKDQRNLIEKGNLTGAEADRVNFEREVAKYVGAPLLGAFSFASGAVMMTNVLNPKTITGVPLSWLIGGNPLLEGVWFFGNGVVCFKTSYDFFMISLEDHEDVQKIVKEMKGLLPSAATQA